MSLTIYDAVIALWGVFYAVWILAARKVKENSRAESSRSRAIIEVLLLVGFALNLTPWFRFGPLGRRFLPETFGWAFGGSLIEALGLGLALIARIYLGANWSGRITIKADHQLITSGPYAMTRHPIYTGLLLGLLGTAVAIGEVRCLVGLGVVLVALLRRILQEERFLSEQFGPLYEQYRRRVKALVPYLL